MSVRRALGDGFWQSWGDNPLPEVQQSLCDFFGCLAASATLNDIPRALYDLRQDNSDIRCHPMSMRISIIRDDPVHYIFFPDNYIEADFLVVVNTVATVAKIIRHVWDRDSMVMVQRLLERCIPFQLCIRGPPQKTTQTYLPLVSSLGYRRERSTFDDIDFMLYKNLHDKFFRSPHGHLALLAGGIIARLAREIITDDRVYEGPMSDVERAGMCMGNVEQGVGYYSDVLSEAEVNLILGMYKVDIGEFF